MDTYPHKKYHQKMPCCQKCLFREYLSVYHSSRHVHQGHFVVIQWITISKYHGVFGFNVIVLVHTGTRPSHGFPMGEVYFRHCALCDLFPPMKKWDTVMFSYKIKIPSPLSFGTVLTLSSDKTRGRLAPVPTESCGFQVVSHQVLLLVYPCCSAVSVNRTMIQN